MPARVGQLVLVPFGPRTLQGLIVNLPETSLVPEPELRDVKAILGDNPVLSPHHIALACWLSEYYFASLSESVRFVLPSGVESRVVPTVGLAPGVEMPADLTAKQQEIVEALRQRGTMREDNLRVSVGLGQRGFLGASRGLAERGILQWGSLLEAPATGRRTQKTEKHVQLTSAGQASD